MSRIAFVFEMLPRGSESRTSYIVSKFKRFGGKKRTIQKREIFVRNNVIKALYMLYLTLFDLLLKMK